MMNEIDDDVEDEDVDDDVDDEEEEWEWELVPRNLGIISKLLVQPVFDCHFYGGAKSAFLSTESLHCLQS